MIDYLKFAANFTQGSLLHVVIGHSFEKTWFEKNSYPPFTVSHKHQHFFSKKE